MVTQGIKLLREGRHEESASTHSCLNPTATIFTSLVHRKDTIEGHKIMANFECAAAYLSLIFKVSCSLVFFLLSLFVYGHRRVSRTFRTRCLSSRSWFKEFGKFFRSIQVFSVSQ
jgi:hypothetical protein